jgi:Ca2+-binding EF-hand superfamily protein
LSKREVKRIMAEADENENGEIDYSEFIPIALDLVQAMYVKVDREQEMDKSRRQTELLLLHGMPREEIEAIMSAIFQKADLDGSGTLSRKEFHSCLRGADLGLTRTEINLIMGSIDADEDGTISYSEFVPLCYSLLVETLRDEIESTRTPTQLEEFLQDLFASHDPDRAGVLPISTLKKALRAADLGLTRLQMHTVLAEARESDDGEVAYGKFAPVAADVIYRLLDSGAQAAKLEAIRALTGPDGKSDGLVHNLDERAMADTLIELFEASDTAQASSLPKGTIKRVLLDAGLDLSQREVQCLLSSADLDVDGAVMYHSLALGAHRQLAYLALQEGMRS